MNTKNITKNIQESQNKRDNDINTLKFGRNVQISHFADFWFIKTGRMQKNIFNLLFYVFLVHPKNKSQL